MKVAVCDDNREFCEKERTTIKDVFKQYFQGEDCQVDIYNDGQTIISNYSDNAYDMVFLDLELAAGMGTHQARISEAITGKPSGKKFIIPLIQELGGNMDDFKDFLNTV